MAAIHRREFLTSAAFAVGACAAGLPTIARAAIDPRKPGGGMRLGLVTYLWGKDWDLPTLIGNCARTGILGVELRTTHAHGVEPALNAQQRDEVRGRFQDSPVQCLGPGSNESFDHTDGDKLKNAIKQTKDFIRLSHDIGGTGVKVKPNSWQKGVEKAKTIEQVAKALRELGEFAVGFGQEIRVEVHGSIGTDFPALKQIMEACDHDAVRYCWNSNDADLKGAGFDQNFEMIKKWFGRTVHVREFNVGNYPYPQLMAKFVKEDYDGWILLECRTNPADRVAAMIEQRKLWEGMVEKAQPAS